MMADTKTVVTTVSVTFAGDSTDGFIAMEVDSRENGLNAGLQGYRSGDEVGLIMYKSPDVTIQSVVSTVGSVTVGRPSRCSSGAYLSGGGIPNPVVKENIQFIRSMEGQLSKPPKSAVTFTHVGGDTLAITRKGRFLRADKFVNSSIYRADYDADFVYYVLKGVSVPAKTADLEVVIVLIGDQPVY